MGPLTAVLLMPSSDFRPNIHQIVKPVRIQTQRPYLAHLIVCATNFSGDFNSLTEALQRGKETLAVPPNRPAGCN